MTRNKGGAGELCRNVEANVATANFDVAQLMIVCVKPLFFVGGVTDMTLSNKLLGIRLKFQEVPVVCSSVCLKGVI